MAKRPAKTSEPKVATLVAEPDRQNLLTLPETLDLSAAASVAKSLLAMRGTDITIDASQVRHLGGQCAQVLVSAMQTWRHDHADLQIVEGSAEFLAGLKLLGLRSALEIGEAC